MSKCYRCDAEATSADHVPPKCLFPEKKDLPEVVYRKNLLSVPSCETHNNERSHDDEYLLCVLVTSYENNRCTVYDCRPRDCQSYPHLHKKDFLFRMNQAYDNCSVCPIVFNVYEGLKSELWKTKK